MHLLKLIFAVHYKLDTLGLEDDLRTFLPLLADEVEMEIQSCGLKFRDLLIALGQLAADNLRGECAGLVEGAGPRTQSHPDDRVVGFAGVSFAVIGCAKSLHVCKILLQCDCIACPEDPRSMETGLLIYMMAMER